MNKWLALFCLTFLFSIAVILSGCNVVSNTTDTNNPPAIKSLIATPASLIVGSLSALACDATDADGDPLSYTWSCSYGVLSATSGMSVSWTAPSTAGIYTINVKVSDGKTSTNSSLNLIVAATSSGAIPAIPSNIAISPITDTTASVSWDAVSDATNYKLSYGTDTNASNIGVFTTTTNAYSFVELMANTKYYVKVLAENPAGSSEYSDVEDFTTATVPASIPGIPTGLGISATAETTVIISWNAASGANSYIVSYGTDASASNLGTITTSNLSCTLSSLTASTTYYVRVRASNSAGNSAYSSAVGFATTATSHWQTVGSAGFSGGMAYPSLFVYSGTPYVAYRDDADNNYKATVRKFNGINWEIVGSAGFSAGLLEYTSLFVYNGTPYVAYEDYTQSRKVTVMKFNGANWELVGNAGFSPGEAHYTSLFVYNGTPYVAYGANAGNGAKATVMKFNGTNWETVGSAGFSAGAAYYTSLYVYNGTPYIAYRDAYSNGGVCYKATVMKFNGANWEAVGSAGFSAASVSHTSLNVYNGTPYLAYRDVGSGGKVTVMRYNGINWELVGSAGFSAGNTYYASLSICSGTLYVACGEKNTNATVMKFNGTNWETVGLASFSNIADQACLYVYNGVPYVAYQDRDFKATVMKFE